MTFPDESTSLLPEARPALNWRQKCRKFSCWSLCFGYFLLLLEDMAASIYRLVFVLVDIDDTFIELQNSDASTLPIEEVDGSAKQFECQLVVDIVLIFIDTCICWMFLGIVARSPHFVGCFTILKNLIRLPRFWSLVLLVVLYITATVLELLFSLSSLQSQDALVKVIKILLAMESVMELLNVFTKLALVGVLNHVHVQNVARSRFKYSLLKVTLVVTWFCQFCNLIGATWFAYFSFIKTTVTGNSYVQQVILSTQAVTELLLLPFVIRTTEQMNVLLVKTKAIVSLGTILVSHTLFAPVPCSASINKSSAYHFGSVRVRILLAQNRVMADAQVPVQAAVPVAQALVQPPAAPADVDNPQQDPAPLQVLISFLVIYSLDCLGFSPIRLRLVIPRGRLLVPLSSFFASSGFL